MHHLGNFNSAGHPQTAIVDFGIFNYDTFFISLALGVAACLVMWLIARKAHSGAPGRAQAALEILVEMVEVRPR